MVLQCGCEVYDGHPGIISLSATVALRMKVGVPPGVRGNRSGTGQRSVGRLGVQ